MSGIEIYGAVLATGTLIQACKAARDRWKGASRTWESLNQAIKIQHENLKTLTTAAESTFEKYHRDLKTSLSQEDRRAIFEIIQNIHKLGGKCERIVARWQSAIKKDPINVDEVNGLRDELAIAVSGIGRWHDTFVAHISMESCRRLNASPLRGDSRNADQPKSGSITSVESGPYLSNQRGTRLSTESTLSQPSTSRSSVSSAEAGKACSFVKNERLNTAVQTNKVENVKSIIRHGGNEESLKATALIYSCRYRKTSIVEHLLSMNADIHVYDDAGLGVIHCTIGTSQIIRPEIAIDINRTLKILVKNKASLLAPAKTPLRRTPLHYCAETGNYDTAKYILEAKREAVNVVDNHKKTPLYVACEDNSPRNDLIQLLLDKGATFATKPRPKSLNNARRKTINEMLDEAHRKRLQAEKGTPKTSAT